VYSCFLKKEGKTIDAAGQGSALPIPAPNLGEGIPPPIFNFGAGILSPYQIFSKLHLVRGYYPFGELNSCELGVFRF